MSENDASAAPDAAGDATEGTPAAGGTPGTAGTAPADDRGAEDMLADAISSDDGTSDDPAKSLAAAQAEARKWRDLSRKNEAQAKKNADAARKLAEIDEASKTEAQKLTDRAAAAEQRATESEARYHRTLAAATYGLPPSLIDRIAGATEEEINSSAEELAAEINQRVAEQVAAAATGQPRTGGTRPVESLRPGAAPAGNDRASTDANVLFRQLMGQN
jgi:hypothetical protein